MMDPYKRLAIGTMPPIIAVMVAGLVVMFAASLDFFGMIGHRTTTTLIGVGIGVAMLGWMWMATAWMIELICLLRDKEPPNDA